MFIDDDCVVSRMHLYIVKWLKKKIAMRMKNIHDIKIKSSIWQQKWLEYCHIYT